MISQTTEYALRAAAALAAGGTAPRTGRELAAETRIPRGYLTKVLAPLVRARLVRANRGAGGGYTLERDPASVALLEVMHAVEPPPAVSDAPAGRLCALHRRIEQATASFEKAFANCTLADLVAARTPDAVPHPAGAAPSAPAAARSSPCVRCRTVERRLSTSP